MNTQDLAVSVHRLTKRYGHTEVLKDVNMEIEKGSIYCLLGSNGAGKTTTIKILTTLAAFDSGEVSVCGHSVTAEGEAVRKLISLTGQFASVDEKLSGYENLDDRKAESSEDAKEKGRRAACIFLPYRSR